MAKSKKIKSYGGSLTEIVIPTSIDGTLIREIKEDAFAGKGITKIILSCYGDNLPAGAPWGATGATIETISGTLVNAPTVSGNFTYDGTEKTVTISGYDTEYMTMTGDSKATNAGNYLLTFTLKPDCLWKDGTSKPKTYNWTIAKKEITNATVTLNGQLTYNGSEQTQYVASVIIDSLSATYSVSNNKQTNAGTYTLTCTGTGNFSGSVNKEFSIAKATPTFSLSSTEVVLSEESPSANVTVTTNGDGVLSATSNNTSVATVSVDNKIVTINNVDKTEGIATISVVLAEGSNYLSANGSIAVSTSFVKEAILDRFEISENIETLTINNI